MESRNQEKVKAVQVNHQDVYLVPKKNDETQMSKPISVINYNYEPDDNIKESGGIISFFKRKLKKQNEDEIVNTEEQNKSVLREKTQAEKYNEIIAHAKKIKENKEKNKILQNRYFETLKNGNKEKSEEINNNLWELQNQIALQESFLKNQIKEIKKSSLNEEEKTRLINYICGIAKIKTKEIKENSEEAETDQIKQLNERKAKIVASKHFTNLQKKNMINQIDDELINIQKKLEKKSEETQRKR